MDMDELVKQAVNDPELTDMSEEEIRTAFEAFSDPVTTITTLLRKQNRGEELTEMEDGAVYSASLILLTRVLMEQGLDIEQASQMIEAYENIDEARGGSGMPNVYSDPGTGAVIVTLGPIQTLAVSKDSDVDPQEVFTRLGLRLDEEAGVLVGRGGDDDDEEEEG